MKHLPKHLRQRWRYVAVGLESWPDAEIDRSAFQRHLWYTAQDLVGDTGSSDVDLTVVEFSFTDGDGEAIVRTRRGEVETARAILACLDAVGSAPVGLYVRGVSGTVRACEEKYLGRGPKAIQQRTVAFGDAARDAFERDDRVDVRTGAAFAGATELDFQ
jgi:ribonuclease P/MRP protein subunit POP5